MEDVGFDCGRDAGQLGQAGDLWQTQRAVWRRATKRAQLAFGGLVLDCALLDVSGGGTQVRLLTAAEVPEIATLRLLDGESWPVRRQWQRGTQVGFKIAGTGFPTITD